MRFNAKEKKTIKKKSEIYYLNYAFFYNTLTAILYLKIQFDRRYEFLNFTYISMRIRETKKKKKKFYIIKPDGTEKSSRLIT